jgi:hypothetical protein
MFMFLIYLKWLFLETSCFAGDLRICWNCYCGLLSYGVLVIILFQVWFFMVLGYSIICGLWTLCWWIFSCFTLNLNIGLASNINICWCLLRTLIKWNVIRWQFCSIYIIHGRSVGVPDKHVWKDYDIIFYNSNITVSLFSKFLAFRPLQKHHIKHKWANFHCGFSIVPFNLPTSYSPF